MSTRARNFANGSAIRQLVLWLGIALGGGIFLYGCAGIMGTLSSYESSPEGRGAALHASAKSWARENLADGKAEVMGFGAMHEHRGQTYAVVRIRGKNAFGGPVVNDFVAHISGTTVLTMWKPREFFQVESLQLQDGLAELVPQGKRDLAKLADDLGFASALAD